MRPVDRLTTVIIFLREPRIGRAKKRLSKDVGPIAAWNFYRRTMFKLFKRLSTDHRWRLVVFVTPDRVSGTKYWKGNIRVFGQGYGDLGKRMERALLSVTSRRVILIGSDIPGIRAANIALAMRKLTTGKIIFGPAKDGGFWLIGVHNFCSAKRLFTDVTWSSEHTLADTLLNIPTHYKVDFVDSMRDVDRGEDLVASNAEGIVYSESRGISSAKLQGL